MLNYTLVYPVHREDRWQIKASENDFWHLFNASANKWTCSVELKMVPQI